MNSVDLIFVSLEKCHFYEIHQSLSLLREHEATCRTFWLICVFCSEEEGGEGPGLAALMGDDLGSDDDDGDYDSNEEPEGSDGEQDDSEGENENAAEDGAGPSGSG